MRGDTSLCSLDEEMENRSHLCKLHNNQEQWLSYPGCREETSTVSTHKARLEAAGTSASEVGEWGIRDVFRGEIGFLQQDLRKRDKAPSCSDGNWKPLCLFQTNQSPFWSSKSISREQITLYPPTKSQPRKRSTELEKQGGTSPCSLCLFLNINNTYFKIREITEEPLASREVD